MGRCPDRRRRRRRDRPDALSGRDPDHARTHRPATDFVEPPETSLRETAQRSTDAILARVTDRAYGFWWGIPGQLLRLDIEETYRGGTIPEVSYLFVPQGDFELGPFRVVKTDPRFPEPPAIGGEVFLFTWPHIRSELFVPLHGRGYVPVDSDGRLLPGADYRASEDASDRPIRTKADLIHRLEEAGASDTSSR